MCVLPVNFCSGNTEPVLQLCCQAFYNHSLFLQAVHPWSTKPEGDNRYRHFKVSISPNSLHRFTFPARSFPLLFKTSGMVTLLDDTGGGGGCEVFPLTTAWGAAFVISGCTRLSFIGNGSFYDIDRGIEPDVIFTRIPTFRNRLKVTDIISSLC
jgi:hypothetical protein